MKIDDDKGKTRCVAVYSTKIMAYSHVFIRRQIMAFSLWRPIVVGGKVLNELSLDGIQTIETRKPFLLGEIKELLLWHFSWAPRLEKHLAEENVEVFHAHFGNSAYAILPFVRKVKIPFVVTFHGMDAAHIAPLEGVSRKEKLYPDRALRQRHKKLFSQADAILCVSEHVMNCLRRAGAPEEKLQKHYIGVEVPDKEQVFPLRADLEILRILFVGRFVEKKGIFDLLAALESLSFSNFELVMIGGGESSAVEEWLERLPGKCEMLGVVDQGRVREEMMQSSVLVVPSKTSRGGDQEGLPTVIPEAMACGLPVLATRHAGIPEIVFGDETGILIDENSPEQLARALEMIYRKEIDCELLAKNAYEFVSHNFNVSVQSGLLEEIYNSVVINRQ